MTATDPTAMRGDPMRGDEPPRLLSRETMAAVWDQVLAEMQGGGTASGAIISRWSGEVRWGRNRVALSSERDNIFVAIVRWLNGHHGEAYLNQIDAASIRAGVRAAERNASLFGSRLKRREFETEPPPFTYAKPTIWSDSTFGLPADVRGEIARKVMDPAEAADMLCAGYLQVRGAASAKFVAGKSTPLFSSHTEGECSLTVRDGRGMGSGWAGQSSYDWNAIDPGALAARALEKALASRNPVALEPGRYTVILEPQAVVGLLEALVSPTSGALNRDRPEKFQGGGPFTLGPDPAIGMARSKLGLKIVDERITLSSDPEDPLIGVTPYESGSGAEPHRAMTWVDRGKLVALADKRDYAAETRNERLSSPAPVGFRMTGGETSIDEMVKTTKRGLLVTRFSNVRTLDGVSLLSTGLTRDGLWLIENGQITKAVKNFRFTESPLFVLNSIEQLGVPVPVFRRPEGEFNHSPTPAIVPPLKARDFSFTSTIDAI